MGYIPALEYTINALNKPPAMQGSPFQPELLLERYLDFRGGKSEIARWWDKNKNSIQFNPARMKYYVAGSRR